MTPKVKTELLQDGIARLTIETASKNGDGREILAERKLPTVEVAEAKVALVEAVRGADWPGAVPNGRGLRREMAKRVLADIFPAQIGRPRAVEPRRQRGVSLTEVEWTLAEQLDPTGQDNASNGIRWALREAAPKTK